MYAVLLPALVHAETGGQMVVSKLKCSPYHRVAHSSEVQCVSVFCFVPPSPHQVLRIMEPGAARCVLFLPQLLNGDSVSSASVAATETGATRVSCARLRSKHRTLSKRSAPNQVTSYCLHVSPFNDDGYEHA